MDSSVKDEITQEIYIANHESPVAKVEEPVFSDAGVAKNKAIKISFSIPMDPSTFANSYRIEDSAGTSLLTCYQEPQWSNDNKLVVIYANEKNLISMNGEQTRDIYFKLSKNCKTSDNLPIQNAINHKYRINDQIDNKAPVLSVSSYAERPAIYFAGKQVYNSIRIKEGSITDGNEEEIINENHINSVLTLYIEGNDNDGGDVSGHVFVRRLYDVEGNKVDESAKEFFYDLEINNDSEIFSGTYTLDLSSNDYYDGLYEVKIFVQDTAGLDSAECKTYYVVRDIMLAYCLNARVINDTPIFRPGVESIFDSQTATLKKIEDFRSRIYFNNVEKDVFFKFKQKNYFQEQADFIYFVSWGFDTKNLTSPVRIEGKYYTDETIAPVDDLKYYTLPNDCISFMKDNEDKDLILKVTYIDSVGNANEIFSVWPRKFDFYNYIVSNGENQTKDLTLNISDLTGAKIIADKEIYERRPKIFYAELGSSDKEFDLLKIDLSDKDLIRNLKPPKANTHDEADSCEIKGLKASTKYVVLIQSVYDVNSALNGQYTSTTFGPVIKFIVDTSKSSGGTITKPEFTIGEKKSAGINSCEFILPVTITNHEEDLNYVPYYWCIVEPEHWITNDNKEPELVPDKWGWIKLESHREKNFNVKVKNLLRAPLKQDESWDIAEWDYTDYGNGNIPDNTYFMAVENCRNKVGYPSVKTKIKIVATDGLTTKESSEIEVDYNEADDNIPPVISSEITKHDSHLSFDGHCFEFSDLIREDEGNLTEFFTYYYIPYNPAWGDNLNVLSENQIKELPSGRAPYTGSCWLDDINHIRGAEYRLDTSIPVFGLPDGDYMYFAKLEDRYGNYTYATLGKAHIGTFKNKLKVELDEEGKYFVSKLELEPDESFFDRNLINYQICYDSQWSNYYDWLNEIQNCERKTEDGKIILYSNIGDTNDPNKFMYRDENNPDFFNNYDLPKNRDKVSENPEKWEINPDNDRILDNGQWYRITMQSYNENNDVNFRYGRPYSSIEEYNKDSNSIWNGRPNWVEGEQKYDLCTEETVSNTVYYYVPWKDNNGREDFSDYYASFFSSTATPRSNHSMLVNVLVSNCDLGQDSDEWERRGKLVSTHVYKEWNDISRLINCDFDQSVAAEDVSKAREQGLVYYAAVVHFAKGESVVSDVYTMYGY